MVAQRADELFYDGPDGEALASADERDLTIAFKSGSEDAYSVIYGRYRPRVESLCRRMLANPHDAQEATQEAFLRVFQSLHSFNGRYQLGAWITRIATNVCLDNLRTQARRPIQPTPMEEMELTLPDKGIDSDPEFFVIRRAESRRVRRVLESLPPMHRAAIILRDFEGLSYSEVAIALGITDAQVKALLHRARAGFKRAWNPAAVASMFLPARFVDRFRKVEHTVGERASHAAKTATPLSDIAASASQAAASCGGFIQQCGVVVSERFATAAAAVVVTAGAVAGVGTTPPSAQAQPPTMMASTDVSDHAPDHADRKGKQKREHTPDAPVVVPTPDPTTPDPNPQPEPDANSDANSDGPAPRWWREPAARPSALADTEPLLRVLQLNDQRWRQAGVVLGYGRLCRRDRLATGHLGHPLRLRGAADDHDPRYLRQRSPGRDAHQGRARVLLRRRCIECHPQEERAEAPDLLLRLLQQYRGGSPGSGRDARLWAICGESHARLFRGVCGSSRRHAICAVGFLRLSTQGWKGRGWLRSRRNRLKRFDQAKQLPAIHVVSNHEEEADCCQMQ